MKNYTKRDFVKLLGLGLVTVPFWNFYSSCNNPQTQSEPKRPNNDNVQPEEISSPGLDTYTPSDLILLTLNDEDYTNYNKYFNARIQKLPKYIAVCKSVLGVQHAILIANKENLPIAVRSGGHSFEGYSNNNDGMVINVAHMKQVNWLTSEQVTIQAGCVLQEVQQALFAKKRLIPSGSCGTVGISGLTLGGGYGFFSRKFGLTCDQVLDFEMVDADGKVRKASEDKELMWALKGGGNGNFGVITQLTFQTQAMPSLFYAHTLKFRNLTSDRYKNLISLWFQQTQNLAPEDFGAFVLNGSTLTILMTTFGQEKRLIQQIDPLVHLADTYNSSKQKDLPTAMKRYYGRTGPMLFKNASAGLYASFDTISDITTEIFDQVQNYKGLIYQINTLGGAISQKSFAENSCYPHRSLPYLSELQAYYDQKSQEPRLLEGFEKIQKIVRNHGIIAQYINYPDSNFKDWQEAYYGTNYSKLQQIKKRIDPINRFQYEQSAKA